MLGSLLYCLIALFFAVFSYAANRMAEGQRRWVRVAALFGVGGLPTIIMGLPLLLGVASGEPFERSKTYALTIGTLPISFLAIAAGLVAQRVWRARRPIDPE